jgi:hypothetical protein
LFFLPENVYFWCVLARLQVSVEQKLKVFELNLFAPIENWTLSTIFLKLNEWMGRLVGWLLGLSFGSRMFDFYQCLCLLLNLKINEYAETVTRYGKILRTKLLRNENFLNEEQPLLWIHSQSNTLFDKYNSDNYEWSWSYYYIDNIKKRKHNYRKFDMIIKRQFYNNIIAN